MVITDRIFEGKKEQVVLLGEDESGHPHTLIENELVPCLKIDQKNDECYDECYDEYHVDFLMVGPDRLELSYDGLKDRYSAVEL